MADVAMLAGLVVIVVAIVDWRRGRSGLLHYRLNKEKSPDRYWAAVVLYFNMGFGLLWLSGQVSEDRMEALCDFTDGQTCTFTLEGKVEP